MATTPIHDRPSLAPRTEAPTAKRGRRALVWGLVLVVVLGTAYFLAVPVLAWSKVTKVDAEPDGPRPAARSGTTYLLVGSDSREDLTERERELLHTGDAAGGRADTIMLLHDGAGPTLLLSIPRASLVHVPGHGTATISSAYAYGGPELLVEAVEQATGLRVDNYIEIGIGGVVNMVDTVGGITICPTARMDDKRAGLHVEPGCQHADGRRALAYARSRHAQRLDDLDRATHQREVVSATGSEVFSPATFGDPSRYWDVVNAGAESITVGENVGPMDFAQFLLAMRHVAGGSGLTCGMPVTGYAVSAVYWDEERADADPRPDPDGPHRPDRRRPLPAVRAGYGGTRRGASQSRCVSERRGASVVNRGSTPDSVLVQRWLKRQAFVRSCGASRTVRPRPTRRGRRRAGPGTPTGARPGRAVAPSSRRRCCGTSVRRGRRRPGRTAAGARRPPSPPCPPAASRGPRSLEPVCAHHVSKARSRAACPRSFGWKLLWIQFIGLKRWSASPLTDRRPTKLTPGREPPTGSQSCTPAAANACPVCGMNSSPVAVAAACTARLSPFRKSLMNRTSPPDRARSSHGSVSPGSM